ncbi:MAG: hypothetical protein AAGD47_02590 [Pseudomonadota bacterium]
MRHLWRKRSIAGFLLLGGALVAACSHPTPYGPSTGQGGYSDKVIEDNRYWVSFRGNSLTPRDTVETYLLFRAAELTIESGRDWFRIADQDTEVSTRYNGFTTGFGRAGFGPYGYRSGFGGGFATGIGTTSLRPVSQYEAFANILVYSGVKPEDDAEAYDAREVLENLSPDIVFR